MEDEQKFVINDKILSRDELFKDEEEFRKRRDKLPFEEKIKALVELQKLAKSWK